MAVVKVSPAKKQTRTYNGVKPWSNRESVWVANQDRPTDKKVGKIGNDAVSAIEALFAAKVDSFEIPEIKASKNRALKSKVRKATNMIEIMAYSAAIIIEENGKEAEKPKCKRICHCA